MDDTRPPPLVRAILTAERARTKAAGRWTGSDEESRDAAQEAQSHALAAMQHLEAGRFDDAQALAELSLELEEEHGPGDVWREFCLLVEEAAELGRSG